MAMKKQRTNGSVVSLKGHDKDTGVFVHRRSANGLMISSMDRNVYDIALANAKAALRKKAVAVG